MHSCTNNMVINLIKLFCEYSVIISDLSIAETELGINVLENITTIFANSTAKNLLRILPSKNNKAKINQ